MTNAHSIAGGMVWMAVAGVLLLGALKPEVDTSKATAPTHQVASASTPSADAAI